MSTTTIHPDKGHEDEHFNKCVLAVSLTPPLSTASASTPSQGPPRRGGGRGEIWRFNATRSREHRDYRLIDGWQQPHPHLDGLYESVEEALADAIGWLESRGAEAEEASIGLEVSTPCGSWRTIRQPDLLLCPLPQATWPPSEKG